MLICTNTSNKSGVVIVRKSSLKVRKGGKNDVCELRGQRDGILDVGGWEDILARLDWVLSVCVESVVSV